MLVVISSTYLFRLHFHIFPFLSFYTWDWKEMWAICPFLVLRVDLEAFFEVFQRLWPILQETELTNLDLCKCKALEKLIWFLFTKIFIRNIGCFYVLWSNIRSRFSYTNEMNAFMHSLPLMVHVGKIVYYCFERQNFKHCCCEDRPVTLKMKIFSYLCFLISLPNSLTYF